MGNVTPYISPTIFKITIDIEISKKYYRCKFNWDKRLSQKNQNLILNIYIFSTNAEENQDIGGGLKKQCPKVFFIVKSFYIRVHFTLVFFLLTDFLDEKAFRYS